MTDGLDLGAIEERWAKAIPGPYEFWLDEGSMAWVVDNDGRRLAQVHGFYWPTAHALAHAPTDIRALLDEVRRLRKTAHDHAS
ncbi:hypothetical protein [Streptomyces sp. NPDC058268]|uniref:hypothetical protein n=1 Tax=Streptomyces sp. NPDC058268 TaxID=3346413 RepID=UPI0036EDE5B7